MTEFRQSILKELKEKMRKCDDFLHRLANYPRFLTILVSGAYAPMVLMPQEKQ